MLLQFTGNFFQSISLFIGCIPTHPFIQRTGCVTFLIQPLTSLSSFTLRCVAAPARPAEKYVDLSEHAELDDEMFVFTSELQRYSYWSESYIMDCLSQFRCVQNTENRQVWKAGTERSIRFLVLFILWSCITRSKSGNEFILDYIYIGKVFVHLLLLRQHQNTDALRALLTVTLTGLKVAPALQMFKCYPALI